MWVSIFVAKDKNEADRIMARLDDEGFVNRIRPGTGGIMQDGQLEVQVLESEALDAQQFCY
ncbi:MAG: hypothetical protein UHB38_10560 [Anaerovibrio sp.]|uniref:Glutamate decarboxylase n=1 Tax=Anaerovibrio slackiae TaxID=2652309 RepID=A0A6I2UJ77_9FIRM|nr:MULTISPECIES: hypothetical protein [Anaerovibrio]MBQ2009033.1 hypothetical protein [Selenomonadaceae bacterium]MBQ2410744.1 hypothetical protein [Selenomonadaceae bacterium]MBQ5585277.1 hypothetical protein [Selenomonadaceae bacterium]MBQ5651336.1 hypothetical protein [Selenomonadaceae bacterium]MBQ5732923.1 hypothetical protein [Selenomonadaceae bacterium]